MIRNSKQVGVYRDEGPPVPIPNTAVKLISADNTWLEAAREDKAMPTQIPVKGHTLTGLYFASLAQSVEHAAVNRRVVGSSPTGGAKEKTTRKGGFFFGIFSFTRTNDPCVQGSHIAAVNCRRQNSPVDCFAVAMQSRCGSTEHLKTELVRVQQVAPGWGNETPTTSKPLEKSRGFVIFIDTFQM